MEKLGTALLDEALQTLIRELHEWKKLMVCLTGAVQAAWPPNKYNGWILVLRKCSKSKKCTMCPHGMFWRHYYAKPVFIWAKGKDASSETLPIAKLYCSKRKREAFIAAEAIRVRIMEKHKSLVALKLKLDRKKQGLSASHKKEIDDEFVRALYDIMGKMIEGYSVSRNEIARNINTFKGLNPSYKGQVFHSGAERAMKRKKHYASKEEKKYM